MVSERTKLYKKRAILFTVLSTLLWIGVALFAVISAYTKGFNTGHNPDGTPIFSEAFKTVLISIGTTLVIALILTIFMQNKMRMTIWMGSVILCTITYGQTAMYIIFSLWFIDEYIIHNLAKINKSKYTINKEIDARG